MPKDSLDYVVPADDRDRLQARVAPWARKHVFIEAMPEQLCPEHVRCVRPPGRFARRRCSRLRRRSRQRRVAGGFARLVGLGWWLRGLGGGLVRAARVRRARGYDEGLRAPAGRPAHRPVVGPTANHSLRSDRLPLHRGEELCVRPCGLRDSDYHSALTLSAIHNKTHPSQSSRTLPGTVQLPDGVVQPHAQRCVVVAHGHQQLEQRVDGVVELALRRESAKLLA